MLYAFISFTLFCFLQNCRSLISASLRRSFAFAQSAYAKFILEIPSSLPAVRFAFAAAHLGIHLFGLGHFVPRRPTEFPLGKALVLLVMLDCICCQTSICILSTSFSTTGLTDLCHERSHLMVGFALICFQRLSARNTATGHLPLAG